MVRGRHHVDVRQQHVGLQAWVRASDSEQVAVFSHNFMLDKAGPEHCREGYKQSDDKQGEKARFKFPLVFPPSGAPAP